MVVLSVPSTLSNFDGEISHVVIVGSETLVIVKTTAWIENKRKIDAMIDCLLPSLSQIKSPSEIKSGEVYIINVKGSYERAYIIRRPLPDSYTIYLIDRGMQFEMRYGDVYEYPPELFEFGVFTCVCPVLVPHAEETVYSVYIGYKCKCIVESVSISRVLMGFVNGQLMVEIGGHYENLQDIISQKLANRPGSSGLALTKLHLTAGKHAGHAGETDDSFSFSNKSAFRHFFDRKESDIYTSSLSPLPLPERKDFGTLKNPVRMVPEFERDKVKVGTLFYQRGFRQYVPEMLPIRVAVRFDKKDRMMNTFWVVNKDIFIAAERALKEIGSELWRFPPINRRGENFRIRDLPCILCAPSDSSFKFLYRGVPAQYDARTKRLSIFLVDFGWFKWVLPSDVLDISSLDESDPVRNLPVAMIHCREDKTSPLHAKDLIKGTNCEIIIKGNAQRDVYTVDLVEPFYMSSRTDSISTQQTSARGGTALGNTREAFGNIQETLENAREALGNTREAEVLSSCRRLVTETCQRQLMTNVMMETLNIANRELAQHPRYFWPPVYPATFPVAMPMVMPMSFPVMIPMQISSPNIHSAGDNVAVGPENTAANNLESVNFSNNDSTARSGARVANNDRSPRTDRMQRSGARFQSNNSPLELPRRGFRFKNEFGVAASDKNKQMSKTEEVNYLRSWDLPPGDIKESRRLERMGELNAREGQNTYWEKGFGEDRSGYKQNKQTSKKEEVDYSRSWDLPPDDIKESRRLERMGQLNAREGQDTQFEKGVGENGTGDKQQDRNQSPFGGD